MKLLDGDFEVSRKADGSIDLIKLYGHIRTDEPQGARKAYLQTLTDSNRIRSRQVATLAIYTAIHCLSSSKAV